MILTDNALTDTHQPRPVADTTKPTVFVDGASGTTGLGIQERLRQQSDVVVKSIAEEKRKDAGAKHGLSVRGDMRRLPIRTATADGVLYAASLHYAPVESAVREAARGSAAPSSSSGASGRRKRPVPARGAHTPRPAVHGPLAPLRLGQSNPRHLTLD